MPDPVRIALVGLGNMGANHARRFANGEIEGAVLGAVVDPDPLRLGAFPKVPHFTSVEELAKSGTADGAVIATPQFTHPDIGIAALEGGLHVLVEKPLAVDKAEGERLLRAHQDKSQVFAIMLNQRTDPHYTKLRALIQNGDLGTIRRVVWIITDWFRPACYFADSTWRGTWKGDGGGVLLNQSPHQLDLLQWLFGMPQRLRAFCHFGLHHAIEVEDDVTAYLEYADGKQILFVTSTGEAPGANRLEISAENGKLLVEDDALVWTRNETPTRDFSAATKEPFGRPGIQHVRIPVNGRGGQHREILQNYVDVIRGAAPSLIAPAEEGLHSVELANAMLYSTWTENTVEFPLDAQAFAKVIAPRVEKSRLRDLPPPKPADLSQTF